MRSLKYAVIYVDMYVYVYVYMYQVISVTVWLYIAQISSVTDRVSIHLYLISLK